MMMIAYLLTHEDCRNLHTFNFSKIKQASYFLKVLKIMK